MAQVKGVSTDLIVTSVGVCAAMPNEKKKAPCVVIAYRKEQGGKVSFVMTDFPAKKPYVAEDILNAIKQAEEVKNVTYVGNDGAKKDIYVCRENSGEVVDIVQRDNANNRFLEGIAEVQSTQLRFAVSLPANFAWKSNKLLDISVDAGAPSTYDKRSYEYAIINAYNACLLGNIFEREELQLQTKGKKCVKIEVRANASVFVEEDVLYIRPIFREYQDCADFYQTEEFSYVDGDDVSTRIFKITYTNRFHDYNLVRA